MAVPEQGAAGAVRVGIAQLSAAPGAVRDNREESVRAARRAFDQGARLVVLPELMLSGYAFSGREDLGRAAERADGAGVRAWTALCQEKNGYLCGGFAERAGARLYDSAVLVGPEGVLLHYRKAHLFGAEKQLFHPGDLGFPVADLPFARVGVLICYDLRFPEAVRLLALQGADIICLPTAWLPGFDRRLHDAAGMAPHGYTALQQANLNQVAILCAGLVGSSGPADFLGASMAAGSAGEVLAGPMSPGQPGVEVVDLDMGAIRGSRDRGELIVPREDRRTDLYQIAYQGQLY